MVRRSSIGGSNAGDRRSRFALAGTSIRIAASSPSPTTAAGPELTPLVTQAASSSRLFQTPGRLVLTAGAAGPRTTVGAAGDELQAIVIAATPKAMNT